MHQSKSDQSRHGGTEAIPGLSIVIPVYNEEENIPEIYRRLKNVLEQVANDWEIIFVDDGSRDNSAGVIRQINVADPRVKIIGLSTNLGHQIALTAGLDHAEGKMVITMDADLQHPPELIPQLISRYQEGAEVVQGVKLVQKKRGWLKILAAFAFYSVICKILRIQIEPNTSDFRLLSRRVVLLLREMRERHRFLRGLIPWLGFKIARVEYEAPERFAGQPKYTLRKLASLALSGVVSFSSVPLRIFFYLGLVGAFLCVGYALFAIAAKIFWEAAPSGWASLIVVITFLGSFQLIAMGIQGEYLAKVYEEIKRRPLYIIAWKKGFSDD